MHFKKGLTVLTGETGAGKSILLGAFQLVLGERADPKALKNPDEKCTVEAEFKLKGRFKDLFSHLELEYAEPCIIRREILPGGRSRAFVNDSPVRLDSLKSLSENLVDIHSQDDQILLFERSFLLELLDGMKKENKELDSFKKAWNEWNENKKELALLDAKWQGERGDPEYQRFLLEELEAASLQKGELESLQDRVETLRNAGSILETLSAIVQVWDSDEQSPLSLLGQILSDIQRISNRWNQGEQLSKRLSLLIEELEDWKREAEEASEELDIDAEVLLEAEERLDLLNRLLHKHKVQGEAELIILRDKMQEMLQSFDMQQEERNALSMKSQELWNKLRESASNLHKRRLADSKKLEDALQKMLRELELPNARIAILLEEQEDIDSLGSSRVEWLFSANPGMELGPMRKAVSGGERSRVMLAIKAIGGQYKQLPTILFDEIDTGISGKVAGKVAEVMRQMGQSMQIMAITHLPQMAAAGNQHFLVSKHNDHNQTQTRVRELDLDERNREIATIISSKGATDVARQQAGELLAYYARL